MVVPSICTAVHIDVRHYAARPYAQLQLETMQKRHLSETMSRGIRSRCGASKRLL
jgi:hypothetical protein